MAKKKTEMVEGDLLAMPASPPAPLPIENAEAPGVLEYVPLTTRERWHVQAFEEFNAEFSLAAPREKAMAYFHELGLQYPRQWLICRRLYGIGPVIPPSDSHPDDLEPNSRQRVCEALNLKPEELKAELEAMRSVWSATVKREAGEERVVPVGEAARRGELAFVDDVLREFGFDEQMFELTIHDAATHEDAPRAKEKNRMEREWFCKRVQDWRRMLSEPMAGAMAREALINELYLRRFQDEMGKLSPSQPKFKSLYEQKRQVEGEFKKQIEQLQDLFPEAAVQGKEGFRWALSSITQAYQEYYAQASNKLIDGLFTAAEIEIMVRESRQSEPRYRLGLNVALVEAMHGLFDPNWRPLFKHGVLKKLDAGFKAAVKQVREESNEHLVDLENGVMPGDGDDFEDLKEPETES